ncbi:hypothetical protein ACH5RR_007170 [Cinchona calisaya]|uniref:Uncharacterized protein n=1 Tax=Cinchona calisaya TaxID=153742 RepID=A0ABD3AR63_9GENT
MEDVLEVGYRIHKEKAAFQNPDGFYFKMINIKTVDGVHKPENEAYKYSPEELLLRKTQDMGYVLQKVQSEEGFDISMERNEAKELRLKKSSRTSVSTDENFPDHVKQ